MSPSTSWPDVSTYCPVPGWEADVLKNLIKSFILSEILAPHPQSGYNFKKEMH